MAKLARSTAQLRSCHPQRCVMSMDYNNDVNRHVFMKINKTGFVDSLKIGQFNLKF
jgi:hypothetical protein